MGSTYADVFGGTISYTGTGSRSITLAETGNSNRQSNFNFAIGDGLGGATTLIVNNTQSTGAGRWGVNTASTYSGGTVIYGPMELSAYGTANSLGSGNVTIYGGGELVIAATTDLGTGAKVFLDGVSNDYATMSFGFDVTDAQVKAIVDSSASDGVISLFAESGQTTTQSLNMANYGNGTLYLGAGGIAPSNSAETTTYGGTSLGVGSGNVYRLGGGNTSAGQTQTLIIANNVLTAGTTMLIGAPNGTYANNNVVEFTSSQSAFTGSTTVNNGYLTFASNGALAGSAITVNNTAWNVNGGELQHRLYDL